MNDEDYGKFEPHINDFGDDYHKSDDMLYGDSNEAIRKIRRKYRNYNDYLDAVNVITEYLEGLADKYGRKMFRMLYEMGSITEFIPPMPKYRKTERNLLQARYNCYIGDIDTSKQDYELSDEHMQRVAKASTDCGDGLEMRKGHLIYLPITTQQEEDMNKAMDDAETISKELEILQQYSEQQSREYGDKGKEGKKKSSRSLAKEAKRRRKLLEKARRPLSFVETIKRYEDELNGLVPDEDSGMCFYKGILIPRDDFNTIEVMKSFELAGFGVDTSIDTIDSKKLRKMVRSDKKSEKKRKKKEREQEEFDDFLDEHSNDSSDFGTSFDAWQKEMQVFTAAQRFSGVDT